MYIYDTPEKRWRAGCERWTPVEASRYWSAAVQQKTGSGCGKQREKEDGIGSHTSASPKTPHLEYSYSSTRTSSAWICGIDAQSNTELSAVLAFDAAHLVVDQSSGLVDDEELEKHRARHLGAQSTPGQNGAYGCEGGAQSVPLPVTITHLELLRAPAPAASPNSPSHTAAQQHWKIVKHGIDRTGGPFASRLPVRQVWYYYISRGFLLKARRSLRCVAPAAGASCFYVFAHLTIFLGSHIIELLYGDIRLSL